MALEYSDPLCVASYIPSLLLLPYPGASFEITTCRPSDSRAGIIPVFYKEGSSGICWEYLQRLRAVSVHFILMLIATISLILKFKR